MYRAIRHSDSAKVAVKKIAIFDIMDAKSRDKCLKEVKLLQVRPTAAVLTDRSPASLTPAPSASGSRCHIQI